MKTQDINQEIESEIKWRTIYSRFDFILNNILVFIAVVASSYPAYAHIFDTTDDKLVASVAAIPAFILLLQKTFKWEQRAEWHWEYKRKVIAIKRAMRDQGLTIKEASEKLNQIERDLAGSFPSTQSPTKDR